MKNLFFIIIIFFFNIIAQASINLDEDFKGLSKQDYLTALQDLNFSVGMLSQELALQYSVYFYKAKNNVFTSSAFSNSKQISQDLTIIQDAIYKLEKDNHLLVLETRTSINLLKYFDFPFFESLEPVDQQIFDDVIKNQLAENQKFQQTSIELSNKVDSIVAPLRAIFLNTLSSSKEMHVTISEKNKNQILLIKSQLESINQEIKTFTKKLKKHKTISENIFNSYVRKLILGLKVKDSISFKLAFLEYVEQPLNRLYTESGLNPNISSNVFYTSYISNHMKRALYFSELFYYIAPLFLEESEISFYRKKLWDLGKTIQHFNNFDIGVYELVSFLKEHHSDNSLHQCRSLF